MIVEIKAIFIGINTNIRIDLSFDNILTGVDTSRVAVAFLTSWVVVEGVAASVAFLAVEVGLTVAQARVVARESVRTSQVAVARWTNYIHNTIIQHV